MHVVDGGGCPCRESLPLQISGPFGVGALEALSPLCNIHIGDGLQNPELNPVHLLPPQILGSFGVDTLEALSSTCTLYAIGDRQRCAHHWVSDELELQKHGNHHSFGRGWAGRAPHGKDLLSGMHGRAVACHHDFAKAARNHL